MTVDVGRTILMNENYKSRVYEITTRTQLSNEGLETFCEVFFIKLLNQIKGSINNIIYKIEDEV